MLAPWQRNIVAIRTGLTLAPSGKMKWTAHVTVFGVTPRETEKFNWHGDADNETDAARFAAEVSARRVYGDEGTAGFVTDYNAPLYRATIGYYNNGVTRGRSIEMLILCHRHPVTGK